MTAAGAQRSTLDGPRGAASVATSAHVVALCSAGFVHAAVYTAEVACARRLRLLPDAVTALLEACCSLGREKMREGNRFGPGAALVTQSHVRDGPAPGSGSPSLTASLSSSSAGGLATSLGATASGAALALLTGAALPPMPAETRELLKEARARGSAGSSLPHSRSTSRPSSPGSLAVSTVAGGAGAVSGGGGGVDPGALTDALAMDTLRGTRLSLPEGVCLLARLEHVGAGQRTLGWGPRPRDVRVLVQLYGMAGEVQAAESLAFAALDGCSSGAAAVRPGGEARRRLRARHAAALAADAAASVAMRPGSGQGGPGSESGGPGLGEEGPRGHLVHMSGGRTRALRRDSLGLHASADEVAWVWGTGTSSGAGAGAASGSGAHFAPEAGAAADAAFMERARGEGLEESVAVAADARAEAAGLAADGGMLFGKPHAARMAHREVLGLGYETAAGGGRHGEDDEAKDGKHQGGGEEKPLALTDGSHGSSHAFYLPLMEAGELRGEKEQSPARGAVAGAFVPATMSPRQQQQ